MHLDSMIAEGEAAAPVHEILGAPLATLDLTLKVLNKSADDPAAGEDAKRLAEKLQSFRAFVASPEFTALAEYLVTSDPRRAGYLAQMIHGMASDALAELMLTNKPIEQWSPILQLAHQLRRLIRSIEMLRVKGHEVSPVALDAIRRHVISMTGMWVTFAPTIPALPEVAHAQDVEIALYAIAAWADRSAHAHPEPWEAYAQALALRSIVSLESAIGATRIALDREESLPSHGSAPTSSSDQREPGRHTSRRRAKKGEAAEAVKHALSELSQHGWESVTAQRVADYLEIPKSTVTQQKAWREFSAHRRTLPEAHTRKSNKRRTQRFTSNVDERDDALRELSDESETMDAD